MWEPIIQNKTKRDIFYLSGFSTFAIISRVDLFQLFIIFLAIIFIIWGVYTFGKRREESKKFYRRVSSLKREFTNVKQDAHYNQDYNWIKRELEDDNLDYKDIRRLNKK